MTQIKKYQNGSSIFPEKYYSCFFFGFCTISIWVDITQFLSFFQRFFLWKMAFFDLPCIITAIYIVKTYQQSIFFRKDSSCISFHPNDLLWHHMFLLFFLQPLSGGRGYRPRVSFSVLRSPCGILLCHDAWVSQLCSRPAQPHVQDAVYCTPPSQVGPSSLQSVHHQLRPNRDCPNNPVD